MLRMIQGGGSGASEIVREAVPPLLLPLFVGITHLGSFGFLSIVFVLDYWLGKRERGARGLSLLLGGMALIIGLKIFFAEPRPPDEITVIPVSGYRFPSGHALQATVGYGVLAYDTDIGSRWSRGAVAALCVTLIALSRIVLGVHLVRDIVAGVAIGVIFLLLGLWITERAFRSGFLLAAVFGVFAFAVSGGGQDSAALLGATLGGFLVWNAIDLSSTSGLSRSRPAFLVVVLPLVAGLGYLLTNWSLPWPLVFVLGGVMMGAVLVAPFFRAQVRERVL